MNQREEITMKCKQKQTKSNGIAGLVDVRVNQKVFSSPAMTNSFRRNHLHLVVTDPLTTTHNLLNTYSVTAYK